MYIPAWLLVALISVLGFAWIAIKDEGSYGIYDLGPMFLFPLALIWFLVVWMFYLVILVIFQ